MDDKKKNKLLSKLTQDLRSLHYQLGKAYELADYISSDGELIVDCNDLHRGQKIVYLGKNGYPSDTEKANKVLTIGNTYTVKNVEVYSSSSYLSLMEVPGHDFNTVMFGITNPEWDKV